VSDARRLNALEDEDARLRKLLTETTLDNALLKDIALKEWCALRKAGNGRSPRRRI
jgi:putative transposase